MGKFLKQSEVSEGKRRREPKKPASSEASPAKVVVTGPEGDRYTTPAMQHEINHVSGLAGIEESLDWIARELARLTSDEHSITLSTGYGTTPIRITLASDDYEDTMDRFVTAWERIADSAARLAGLNRPRLESWHEQDEYTPRYKDFAADGGAPGPPSQPGTGGGSNVESKTE